MSFALMAAGQPLIDMANDNIKQQIAQKAAQQKAAMDKAKMEREFPTIAERAAQAQGLTPEALQKLSIFMGRETPEEHAAKAKESSEHANYFDLQGDEAKANAEDTRAQTPLKVDNLGLTGDKIKAETKKAEIEGQNDTSFKKGQQQTEITKLNTPKEFGGLGEQAGEYDTQKLNSMPLNVQEALDPKPGEPPAMYKQRLDHIHQIADEDGDEDMKAAIRATIRKNQEAITPPEPSLLQKLFSGSGDEGGV